MVKSSVGNVSAMITASKELLKNFPEKYEKLQEQFQTVDSITWKYSNVW